MNVQVRTLVYAKKISPKQILVQTQVSGSEKCENALNVTPKALSGSQDKRINVMLNKDKSMLWTPGTQSTTEEAAG